MPDLRKLVVTFSLVASALSGFYLLQDDGMWRTLRMMLDPITERPAAPRVLRLPPPASRAVQAVMPAPPVAAATATVAAAESGAQHGGRLCEAPPPKPLAAIRPVTIHRWVDTGGRVQFSDRAPTNASSTVYRPRTPHRPQPFQVAVTYEGQRSVPLLQDHLRADATKIYEVLGTMIGQARLRQFDLNIRVFEYPDDYQAYANRISPRLANTSGFYSLEHNEAVTYAAPDAASTLATARHEAAHVIVAGLFGRSPIWLNEGLAEYFETLHIADQRATIAPQHRWFEMAAAALAGGYPRDLKDYMSLGEAGWYDNHRDVHYALAWSLVDFLMSSAPGRTAVASYLTELADHYCEPVDEFAWLERGYPLGYAGLTRDFYAWLSNRQISAHTY